MVLPLSAGVPGYTWYQLYIPAFLKSSPYPTTKQTINTDWDFGSSLSFVLVIPKEQQHTYNTYQSIDHSYHKGLLYITGYIIIIIYYRILMFKRYRCLSRLGRTFRGRWPNAQEAYQKISFHNFAIWGILGECLSVCSVLVFSQFRPQGLVSLL